MAWDEGALTNGALPLWAQIADRLRGGIRDGEFAVGDDLPSESQLVARFEISRATARNALNQLATEGLVERRSGKGTRVLPSRVELPLNLLSSFSDDMTSRGLQPGYGQVHVSVEPADPQVADALGAEVGTPVVRVERQLLANGAALAYSTSWMSSDVVPTDAVDEVRTFATGSLYRWLEEKCGVRLTHGTELIESGVADEHLALRLGISPGDPVLNATRIARAEDGSPVEYAQRSYRADRYRYRVELVRP